MDAGGAAITIGAATATTEASSQDTDTQVMGIKVSSGNITAAVSQSTYEKAAAAAATGSALQVTTVINAASPTGVIKQTKSL
jgi:hypothetical protein